MSTPGRALLLACLLACAAVGARAGAAAAAPRRVVTFAAGAGPAIEGQLPALGLTVAGRGPGFLVVQPASGGRGGPGAVFAGAKEAAYTEQRAEALASLAGVTSVEADTRAAAPDGRLSDFSARVEAGEARNEWLDNIRQRVGPPECAAGDKPVGAGPFPEIEPYWRSQVQADSQVLKDAVPKTAGRGVLVCVIDSGIDRGHPELAEGPDSLDGCKEEDAAAPAGCPFKWNEDITGHGTHVTGILAAPRNGRGVVGVIPDGADLYYVRVFNDSGDVNQGQGFVYGSSLILAYTQCEGKLAYNRAAEPRKEWRMVISMSVGAPGPLTIEKLFFDEATKRDDMLFIASSGNNGTDESQWLNYPSAYDGVMSVGAVNCKDEVQPWSQKNARVDIVAPGADILSTYPVARSARNGATSGYLAFGNASFNTAPGAYFSGVAALKAPLADCGNGDAPCPEARGAVCMVQSAPRKTVLEDGSHGTVMPSTCAMVKHCLESGARAVVLVPPLSIPDYGPFPRNYVSSPNLDCSAAGRTKCTCWTGALEALHKSGKMPPVIALTIDQAGAVREQAKKAAADKKVVEAFIKTEVAPYRRMSGTSMATPIVSGIAARVWAQFPGCTSHDIRRALETTTKDLGPRGWDKASGHGLVQAEAAFNWLRQQACAAAGAAEPAPAPAGEGEGDAEEDGTFKGRATPVPVPEGAGGGGGAGNSTGRQPAGPPKSAATWVKPAEAPAAAAAAPPAPAAAKADKQAPAPAPAPATPPASPGSPAAKV